MRQATSSFSAAMCSAKVESFPPENRTPSFMLVAFRLKPAYIRDVSANVENVSDCFRECFSQPIYPSYDYCYCRGEIEWTKPKQNSSRLRFWQWLWSLSEPQWHTPTTPTRKLQTRTELTGTMDLTTATRQAIITRTLGLDRTTLMVRTETLALMAAAMVSGVDAWAAWVTWAVSEWEWGCRNRILSHPH